MKIKMVKYKERYCDGCGHKDNSKEIKKVGFNEWLCSKCREKF